MQNFSEHTIKILFFASLLSISNLQASLSDNLWESTTSKQVRGAHYQDYASMDNKSRGYADFFLQTTWGRGDSPSVYGDFISTDIIDSLEEILPINNTFDIKGLTELAKKITYEEETIGALLRFRGKSNEVLIGIDIPVLAQISHLWTDKENQEKLKSLLSGTTKLPVTLSAEDSAELKELATTITKDFSIGDIRLFVETDISRKRVNNLECNFGAECFIPMAFPDTQVAANLKTDRTATFETLNSTQPSKAAGSVLKNIFSTLHRTKLKSQTDNHRAGIGAYLSPRYNIKDSLFSVFAIGRLNYLLAAENTNVFALENTVNLLDETIESRTHTYPFYVAHCIAGVSAHPKNFEITLGYDFFFKSRERITQIKDTIDRESKDVFNSINRKKSERERIAQHRAFLGIGYKSTDPERTIHCALMLNYGFHSVGAPKDWGASLGFGVLF